MPTLAGFNGASLIPDIAGAVREDIGGFQDRRRAAKSKSELEDQIRVVLGGSPSEAKPSKGLSVLGQLAPELSKAASALIGNRDPEATEAFRGEAKQGLALSKTIMGASSFAAKQKILADEVGKVAGQGGDVDRLVKLSNMSEDQLDLELQKMQIIGNGMLKAVPSVKADESLKFFSSEKRRNAFSSVAASNPRIAQSLLAGRDRQIGREDRRARESAAVTKSALAEEREREQLEQIFGIGGASSQPGGVFEGVDPATKRRAQALAVLGKSSDAIKLIQRAVPEPTSAERNAIAQGFDRGTPEFNESVREQTRKIETAEAKELGKGRAKQFAKGRDEAGAASGNLVNLQIIENASQDPNLYTGTGGPTILAAKKALGTLAGADVEGVASGEIIQKAAGKLIEGAIAVQGRSFSDADRVFHLGQNPGLRDSREGLSIALGMARRGEQHKIQRQSLREDFLASNGNLRGVENIIRKFDADYVKKTKGDLVLLRSIAKQKRQKSPFAGMNMKELQSIDPVSLFGEQKRQAAERFEELKSRGR